MPAKSVQFQIDHQNKQQPNIQELQRHIEQETGYTTVIKGLGGLRSAVAELRHPPLATVSDPSARYYGVVRLSQQDDGGCLFDGSIETSTSTLGPESGYRLAVHEYGDLSDDSFNSIGAPLIVIDENCSKSVRKSVSKCDVGSLIGRSIALSMLAEPGHTTPRVLSAGIVARASTVEANTKQVCSCSGKTLWQERLDEKVKQQQGIN